MMKCGIFSEKKGFTLTELLIVVAIIAIMGVLAVGGYIQYRKSATLDLAADNLISFFSQTKSNTIYGADSGERRLFISDGLDEDVFLEEDEEEEPLADAKCFGIEFEEENGEYFLYELRYDFDGRRVWDGEAWRYRGCADESEEKELYVLDRDVEIESVELDGDSFEKTALRFVPPEGIMELRYDEEFDDEFENEELMVMINFSGSERDNRSIKFDLETQYVSKVD